MSHEADEYVILWLIGFSSLVKRDSIAILASIGMSRPPSFGTLATSPFISFTFLKNCSSFATKSLAFLFVLTLLLNCALGSLTFSKCSWTRLYPWVSSIVYSFSFSIISSWATIWSESYKSLKPCVIFWERRMAHFTFPFGLSSWAFFSLKMVMPLQTCPLPCVEAFLPYITLGFLVGFEGSSWTTLKDTFSWDKCGGSSLIAPKSW